MSKNTDFFITRYLEYRPMFLATIRVPEAVLFTKNISLLKNPVLDFGCGDGFFAETVFDGNRIDIGLDIENSRSLKIKDKMIYKKVVFYDGEKIPFADNRFQTVISNCVLEHVTNINAAVKEIYRVLKPGGYFLTSVMADKWNDYQFGKKIFGESYTNHMKTSQVHLNLFSFKKWSKLFISSGFKIYSVTGYLDRQYSQFLDVAHYLSLPSLISYKLFETWQPFPRLTNILWNKFIAKRIKTDIRPKKSAALFFCLKK